MSEITGIDPSVPPSGTGCTEWTRPADGVHLRRCAQCGHIGCCDTSRASMRPPLLPPPAPVHPQLEPGEDWFYSYETKGHVRGAGVGAPETTRLTSRCPAPPGGYDDCASTCTRPLCYMPS